MPLLTVDSLSKTFRDFWRRPSVKAVRDLTFSISRGEVFGLLGPNGSGKSTTIKMILGLLRPTAGSVALLGSAPDAIAARARTGYLPELTHLHPFLTPRETLRYYAGLFGLSRRETALRTAQLLEMTGLAHAADRRVGTFSKGMARRVGLAQALINAPDLLILDEPTSGLDPIGSREVKDLVIALRQTGVTILMTSHLLADVADVCDRVLIMRQGAAQAEGAIGDLLRQPDAVRFTLEALPPERESEIRRAIETLSGLPVRQDYPAMSLERYFLQTVVSGETPPFKPAPFLMREHP